jgi:hypothetical protein
MSLVPIWLVNVDMTWWMLTWLIMDNDMACSGL